jgi:hypothetical protein
MGEGELTEKDDPQTFARVLKAGVDAMEGAGLPYVVFGGIAAIHFGRPNAAEDIDFLVRPQDADIALHALARAGFVTEETDPEWIFKAEREGALVDVIFRVKSGITLDDEVLSHARDGEYAGRPLRLISPEDQLIIEAVSDEEQARAHWFNGLAILVAADLDWDYLRLRARHATHRVLSLLLYARSIDYVVPDDVLADLFDAVVTRVRIPRT